MFRWWKGWPGGVKVTETTVKRLLCCRFRRNGKAMRQVYQYCWMICREIDVLSRLEYHMFYVVYPFVSYLLTLPPIIYMGLSKIHININCKTINNDAVLEKWLAEDSNVMKDLRKLWRQFARINGTDNIRVGMANKSSGSIKSTNFLPTGISTNFWRWALQHD
jgi:hypothetical protein